MKTTKPAQIIVENDYDGLGISPAELAAELTFEKA
jgi:hypothetical protein